MNQLDVRIQLKQAESKFNLVGLKWTTEKLRGAVMENTIDEVIQTSQLIIELFSYLKNTDEEDSAFLKTVYLKLGEALYDRHEKRIRNGSDSEEDYTRLMYAQECFEKGLPLSKEQYTEPDVVAILQSITACQHLYLRTKDVNYLKFSHEMACQTFEKSRQIFSGDQDSNIFNQTLIEDIIMIKCLLSDFEGAEKYISEYTISGVSQSDIEYFKNFIQQKREQSMPKRKKFLGLF